MQYRIGDIVEGTVTGIQPYGAFVLVDGTVNGLIHISEISEDYVRDVHYFVKVGETLRLKVTDVDQRHHQLRLSLKAMRPQNRRAHQQHSRRDRLPEGEIGFRSLEANLPYWIEEGKKAHGL